MVQPVKREIVFRSRNKLHKISETLRIATTSRKGQPDVVPVTFEFDGMYFWIGSGNQDMHLRTHKYLNVKDGNTKIYSNYA